MYALITIITMITIILMITIVVIIRLAAGRRSMRFGQLGRGRFIYSAVLVIN